MWTTILVTLALLGGLVISTWSPAEAGPRGRHAGRLHSVSPADGVVVMEEVGANGQSRMLHVRIRRARVVRVSRDPDDPWHWREWPTQIYRWPAGTLLVVVGRQDRQAFIEAERVEIPVPEPAPSGP